MLTMQHAKLSKLCLQQERLNEKILSYIQAESSFNQLIKCFNQFVRSYPIPALLSAHAVSKIQLRHKCESY